MSTVLPVNFSIDSLLLVVTEPFTFFLQSLLEKNVLFTVLIHVLEEVNTGLVFTSPLLLTSIPLLLVLLLRKFINSALVGCSVTCSVLIMSLEFLDLPTSSVALFLLILLNSCFTVKSLIKKHLIAVLLLLSSSFSKLLFGGVMANKLQVSFAVKKESLVGISLLLLLFNRPLLLEHGLLSLDKICLLLSLNLTGVLLPVKDGHGVFNLLLLLTSLSHLSFELLLGIKLPELSVNLLLKHLLLDVAALVDQLLLALDSGTIVVELGIFFAKSVVFSLELGVLAAGDLIGALRLALGLELLEAVEHLLTDLLGCLQVVVKFLFINAVFSGKEICKARLPLLEVGGVAAAHIVNTVVDDVFLDKLVGLHFPMGLVCQVAVSTDIVLNRCVFLYTSKSELESV